MRKPTHVGMLEVQRVFRDQGLRVLQQARRPNETYWEFRQRAVRILCGHLRRLNLATWTQQWCA
eukprot:7260811-Alexandrium_andersonii.AAC.1